jgi:hypothetical protein
MTCLDDESFFEDLLKKSGSSNDSYELNRSAAVAVAASADHALLPHAQQRLGLHPFVLLSHALLQPPRR